MPNQRARTAAAAAALFLLAGVADASSTMKLLAAEVPIPGDDKPVALPGLTYETKAWQARVESVRLGKVPAADAKKVTWTVVSSNGRGSRMRIDVDLFLLDAGGNRVAAGRKTLLLGAASNGVAEEVDIKLEPGVWAAARSLRIEVRFRS